MAKPWWQRLLNELGETDTERTNRCMAPFVAAWNRMVGWKKYERFTEPTWSKEPTP